MDEATRADQPPGVGPVERQVRPLPKAGPVCWADAQSILEYKLPAVALRRLPGMLDVGLWTSDQMRAFADATETTERERWQRLVAAAQEVTTESVDRIVYFQVPCHLMAALALALDERPNFGGEARLAAHQPSQTTTATPQGVAST